MTEEPMMFLSYITERVDKWVQGSKNTSGFFSDGLKTNCIHGPDLVGMPCTKKNWLLVCKCVAIILTYDNGLPSE